MSFLFVEWLCTSTLREERWESIHPQKSYVYEFAISSARAVMIRYVDVFCSVTFILILLLEMIEWYVEICVFCNLIIIFVSIQTLHNYPDMVVIF